MGVEGKAPDKTQWRWPEVEESSLERLEKAGAFDDYDPDDFETEETAAESVEPAVPGVDWNLPATGELTNVCQNHGNLS
jgi:hypothetical protein